MIITKKRTLIFDAQLFQTSARYRGMGQYISELLNELSMLEELDLIILYSTLLRRKITPDEIIELIGVDGEKIKCVGLPLAGNEPGKSIQHCVTSNRHVLDTWMQTEGLDNPIFIIGSLFQFEICATYPTNAIKAAIVYDLIPLQHYDTYSKNMMWDDYLKQYKLVYEANLLLCISKTVANDLQVYCSIDPSKISVINGGPVKFTGETALDGIADEFILMPTGNDIRKNNDRAIRSFEIFNRNNDYRYSLVITSDFSDEEIEKYKKLAKNIIFTGTISNEEIAWCYKNCLSLFYPSLYEGLGMPLLEAVVFDKPIAASNIDVFKEILNDHYHSFNPLSELEMADAISASINRGMTIQKKMAYKKAKLKFTWHNTAKAVAYAATKFANKIETHQNKKRIAVVGPHYTGVSAIGKFIGELHEKMIEHFNVDYYYERSPIDKELRGNLLGNVSSYYPINKLTNDKIKNYDAVIYNIGNSNHHTITCAKALTSPDIVILHDLNVENVYKDMLDRHLIDVNRFNIEDTLTKKYTKKASFAYSLVKRQNNVIVHSKYGKNITEKMTTQKNITHIPLPIDTPDNMIDNGNKIFTIGMAGIIAGIKGVEIIERIASSSLFANDRVKLFGLNFAEPGLLDRLVNLPNVEILTNLTDYEFQENLKKLDVFVNYRKKYQGEASQATLEAMRYGVPVLVRSDFGWYSELPDNAVIKVNNEEDIIPILIKLKKDTEWHSKLKLNARTTTKKEFTQENYVNKLLELIKER
jgi:glycosyltransferase involved in cell wall biosynthesis